MQMMPVIVYFALGTKLKIKVILHLVAYFFLQKKIGQPDSDRFSSDHDSGDSDLSSPGRNISSGLEKKSE